MGNKFFLIDIHTKGGWEKSKEAYPVQGIQSGIIQIRFIKLIFAGISAGRGIDFFNLLINWDLWGIVKSFGKFLKNRLTFAEADKNFWCDVLNNLI